MSFPFLYILKYFAIFSYCLHFAKFVCLLIKETAEIETEMAEKSSLDQANIRQKLVMVWRNRKKICQIIKDYFYLPFFLLIILWVERTEKMVSVRQMMALRLIGRASKVDPTQEEGEFIFKQGQ